MFLFRSDDIIFNTLTKNVRKIFKMKKSFKFLKFSCHKYDYFIKISYDFLTKNSYNFFSTNDFLYKLYSYVCYEEIY